MGGVRQLWSIMMPEEWIDVQIRTDVDAAELLGIWLILVIQGRMGGRGMIHLYWPKPQWSMEARVRLCKYFRQMDPNVYSRGRHSC